MCHRFKNSSESKVLTEKEVAEENIFHVLIAMHFKIFKIYGSNSFN